MIATKQFGACILTLLLASGCVSPEVVTTRSVEDSSLSCEEIQAQLVQLEEIKVEAEKGRTASGENIAAAILFWPAVIGNATNANFIVQQSGRKSLYLQVKMQFLCLFLKSGKIFVNVGGLEKGDLMMSANNSGYLINRAWCLPCNTEIYALNSRNFMCSKVV